MKTLYPFSLLFFFFGILPIAVSAQSGGTGSSTGTADEKKKEEIIKKAEEYRKMAEENRTALFFEGNSFPFTTGMARGESSELTLSKLFKGETVEFEKNFEIGDDFSRISLSLYGEVKTGSIEVTIHKPDGNKLIAVTIDNTSDVRWRKSLRVTEENHEMKGKWTIKIKTEKAEGRYNFRFTAE